MHTKHMQFFYGEFERAMNHYPESPAQAEAEPVAVALQSGDLDRVRETIRTFMNATEGASSHDHEQAYSLALDGRGNPSFSAHHIPVTALRREGREDFENAVRTGQMDAAAASIGIDQINRLRAILRNILTEINQ